MMSSFSSVVHKPGKKIIPKAAVRRNVQRKVLPVSQSSTSTPIPADPITRTNSLASDTTIRDEDDDLEAIHNPEPAAVSVVHEPTTSSHLENFETGNFPVHEVQRESSTAPIESSILDLAIDSTYEAGHQAAIPPNVVSLATQEVIASESVFPNEHAREVGATSSNDPASRPLRNGTRSRTSARAPSPAIRQQEASDTEDAPSKPRKRRRRTSKAAAEVITSQIWIDPNTALLSPSSLPYFEHSSNDIDQQSEDLFQSATRRAASVSELASDIESQTRALRPRSSHIRPNDTDANVGLKDSDIPYRPEKQTKKKRGKKTLQEQAAEVIANALGKDNSAGGREITPEDAEEYQLEPTKTTMGELCRDRKKGKKSALETEMQANWPDIVQRRREDRERMLANAEKRNRKGMGPRKHILSSSEPVAALAPAMAVVNGVIVVDQASREIDRSAQLQQAANQDLENVREDRDYYKYVNQGTVGIKPGHGQHAKWTEESTELFFKGLRMFGTDFLMIANMFPGLTRKQIKAKFIREENANRARVFECLRNRESVQLEDYAQMSNKESEEFYTLESIQKVLDEQEQRLRDEDNQRRKREGFVTSADGEHIRQSATVETEDGTDRQTGSVEPSRFEAMANTIVEAAVAPKKRQRKTTATNSRRGPKGGRRPEGGIEEVLGSISEVAV